MWFRGGKLSVQLQTVLKPAETENPEIQRNFVLQVGQLSSRTGVISHDWGGK
jgi:hypothetical protein